jgi:hypothetical protein
MGCNMIGAIDVILIAMSVELILMIGAYVRSAL